MRGALAILVAWLMSGTLFAQCGFKVDPIADTKWYRQEGWPTPGMEKHQWVPVNITIEGKQHEFTEGIKLAAIVAAHNSRISFPLTPFEEDGVHKKLRAQTLTLFSLYRWSFHGKPYAYSYDLAPTNSGCSFTMDLVDDRGDGKFRELRMPGHVLFPRQMDPPPVPQWAQKPGA